MANPNRDTRPPSMGKQITVRFDEGELAQVKKLTQTMGVTTAAYVRAVTLDAVKGNTVPTTMAAAIENPQGSDLDRDLLRELRTELNRVGVNYNQISRQIHSQGVDKISHPNALEIHVALGKILRRVESLVGGTKR